MNNATIWLTKQEAELEEKRAADLEKAYLKHILSTTTNKDSLMYSLAALNLVLIENKQDNE